MDALTLIAITAGLLGTGLMYVAMRVRLYSETQTLADQLLLAQTELSTVQKELKGYTQYKKQLDAARQDLVEQFKQPVFQVQREFTHVETLDKDTHRLRSDAALVVKFAVDFSFSQDNSSVGIAVAESPSGVSLKIARPQLVGEPQVRMLSHQLVGVAELTDKNAVLAQVHGKFVNQVRGLGQALAGEDLVRRAARLRAAEGLRDAMSRQPGVVHVPTVFVEMK